MELVNFYFFCHLFSYFVRLLRIPYTLSGMNMIMIMTVLMMISFPHAKMQKMPPFAAMSLFTKMVGQMSHQYFNLPALPMHISDNINPS